MCVVFCFVYRLPLPVDPVGVLYELFSTKENDGFHSSYTSQNNLNEMDALTSSNSGFVTEATIFSGIVTKTWDFHIQDERHTVAVRHSTLDGFRYVLVRFSFFFRLCFRYRNDIYIIRSMVKK